MLSPLSIPNFEQKSPTCDYRQGHNATFVELLQDLRNCKAENCYVIILQREYNASVLKFSRQQVDL
jgi:hypothetical protein